MDVYRALPQNHLPGKLVTAFIILLNLGHGKKRSPRAKGEIRDSAANMAAARVGDTFGYSDSVADEDAILFGVNVRKGAG